MGCPGAGDEFSNSSGNQEEEMEKAASDTKQMDGWMDGRPHTQEKKVNLERQHGGGWCCPSSGLAVTVTQPGAGTLAASWVWALGSQG